MLCPQGYTYISLEDKHGNLSKGSPVGTHGMWGTVLVCSVHHII